LAGKTGSRLWPARPAGIAFGGDYNPEQWPEEVRAQDLALMAEAGVNFLTVGVFSWAALEVSPGIFEWGWLDRVMDDLAGAGIAADLATATASPPPWFSHANPETLPVRADGTTLWWGSRQAFCPSSPTYRDAAVHLAGEIARRYASHPALAMWHVHNEYGCHNSACYCDVSAEAFRVWLAERYGDLKALNEAWGTAFWSQRYTAWDQVIPPRITGTFSNPGQQLDWARFCSDELLACCLAEIAVLKELTPDIPVTTNMMSLFKPLDYQRWADHLDVISNDHYLLNFLDRPEADLSLSGDLMRSLAGGPWWLMEHSPSAVNWQPFNLAKAPGQLVRNSLTHVARGADAVGFFQWRASRAGAEKYHSAMLPHAGRDTKIWREVVSLGADLASISEVAGSKVDARVAILHSWDSWWAAELNAHPTMAVDVAGHIRAWHSALWDMNVTTDVVAPDSQLGDYDLVIAPNLYLLTDSQASNVAAFVQGGGTAVVTYFSGIVDSDDHVRLGGYPGMLRELLGVVVEEFFPLAPGETVRLSDSRSGSIWSELGRAAGAEVIAEFAEGPVAGCPAISRNTFGSGSAFYLATHLSGEDLASFARSVVAHAGVQPVAETPMGVEAVRRISPEASYLFLLNHTGQSADVDVEGLELLSGKRVEGKLTIQPGAVGVVREEQPPAALRR